MSGSLLTRACFTRRTPAPASLLSPASTRHGPSGWVRRLPRAVPRPSLQRQTSVLSAITGATTRASIGFRCLYHPSTRLRTRALNDSIDIQINDAAHGFASASSNVLTGDPRIYGRYVLVHVSVELFSVLRSVYIGTNGRGIFYVCIQTVMFLHHLFAERTN